MVCPLNTRQWSYIGWQNWNLLNHSSNTSVTSKAKWWNFELLAASLFWHPKYDHWHQDIHTTGPVWETHSWRRPVSCQHQIPWTQAHIWYWSGERCRVQLSKSNPELDVNVNVIKTSNNIYLPVVSNILGREVLDPGSHQNSGGEMSQQGELFSVSFARDPGSWSQRSLSNCEVQSMIT